MGNYFPILLIPRLFPKLNIIHKNISPLKIFSPFGTTLAVLSVVGLPPGRPEIKKIAHNYRWLKKQTSGGAVSLPLTRQ